MHMLADSVEVVIGVDTHKHTHTTAVVAAATGQTLASLTVPATQLATSMRPGLPARRWVVTNWPSPERPDPERRCRFGWPLVVRRSRPPVMPNANSTPWLLRHLMSCGNGFGLG